MKRLLFITCDEPPVPPLNGNNRKIYEAMHAVAKQFEIRALCYPSSPEQKAQILDHWQGKGVQWSFLARRRRWRHLRCLISGLSLPTVTRDFAAEERWVRDNSICGRDARLLIDFISGAPLLERISGAGTVLSGHDCMSYLFLQERRSARHAAGWLRFAARRIFALNAERRFAHRAARLHVVSEHDAREFSRVNCGVRPSIIPIAGKTAARENLLPWAQRRDRLFWGSLSSELIVDGFRRLFNAATDRSISFEGWTLIGRVDDEVAHRILPEMRQMKVKYRSHCPDLGKFLGNVRTLVLPDIGGTGQKNRTLDGLAHGCVVCGLEEVFRGIESDGPQAFFAAKNYAELLTAVAAAESSHAADVGEAGRRLFELRFSLDAVADAWVKLLVEAGGLQGG